MDFPADITLRKTRMKFELTFKVVLLFSYQGFMLFFFDTTSLFYHFQKSLSRTFFILFLLFFNSLCILAFSLENVKNFFLRLYSQRRRRDLNPCAATNDLLTFQASPFGLLGTSPNSQQNLFKEDVQTNDFLI